MLRVCMTEYVIMSIEMHPCYCMFFLVQVYMGICIHSLCPYVMCVYMYVIIYSNLFAVLGLNGPTCVSIQH